MIERLQIDGFRGLDGLELDNLGRFNVIIGPGNVGKTNLLEALFLFCSNGDPLLLHKALAFRRLYDADLRNTTTADVAAAIEWFWSAGRKNESWELSGMWDGKDRAVRVSRVNLGSVIPVEREAYNTRVTVEARDLKDSLAAYEVETREEGEVHSGKLYIRPNGLEVKTDNAVNLTGRFVSIFDQGMSKALAPFWSNVEDRGEDAKIVSLLRELDAGVEAVRVGSDRNGTAVLRLHHKKLGRAPIELQGAGFGKALSIACYVNESSEGLLLLDEFDASLHVGAIPKVVEFIMRAAAKRNVQLFVSTHSLETLDVFLDSHSAASDLLGPLGDLRVLQLKRTDEGVRVRNLDAEQASRMRDELGLDLRRTG